MKLQKIPAENEMSKAVIICSALAYPADKHIRVPFCVMPVNSYDFSIKTRMYINAYN